MSNTTELVERPTQQNASVAAQSATASQPRRTTVAPAVDIFEDRNGVTLLVDLPGVPRDKLSVSVQDSTLSLEAEAVVPTPTGLRVQHAELRDPHFARTFALGADLDASRIDAQLRDGVLKLAIPRRDEAKPRRIDVSIG
ncbi:MULTISPECIES: Hsp20/alpha crystallin family protein [Burkholderiaceae]|uniref:Hsp20/alpha crystallin family protein n=1 Tax=Burkholderiaceae TaxID=119060 RepID=UPI0009687106|nr:MULTISPECIES: Hsp20/alpha crystallin family protein [Burkholderiaceae]MCG1018453.1 Hsp20/alpha crystallin family protein [Mycetohabitans sp. B4]SIT66192.1 Molecular chaperone IbpA, HSP20 family [Burkholderia sp. b13]